MLLACREATPPIGERVDASMPEPRGAAWVTWLSGAAGTDFADRPAA
jgi:hypothetical protein